ncbi:hypothetical protein F5880DRAFT_1553719 [Lentinula raphanica]|nr:hypothetical protein F5880DRAFT_1553719 [Lentinula raphanica]
MMFLFLPSRLSFRLQRPPESCKTQKISLIFPFTTLLKDSELMSVDVELSVSADTNGRFQVSIACFTVPLYSRCHSFLILIPSATLFPINFYAIRVMGSAYILVFVLACCFVYVSVSFVSVLPIGLVRTWNSEYYPNPLSLLRSA